MVKGERIHWVKGKPPVDEPECGFSNEYCVTHEICNGSKLKMILRSLQCITNAQYTFLAFAACKLVIGGGLVALCCVFAVTLVILHRYSTCIRITFKYTDRHYTMHVMTQIFT